MRCAENISWWKVFSTFLHYSPSNIFKARRGPAYAMLVTVLKAASLLIKILFFVTQTSLLLVDIDSTIISSNNKACLHCGQKVKPAMLAKSRLGVYCDYRSHRIKKMD